MVKHSYLVLVLMLLLVSVCSCSKGDSSVPAVCTVSTGSVSAIGLTTATVSGSITSEGSDPVIAQGFVYAADSANLATAGKRVVVTGTFSAGLTGLQPNTIYYVKALAINKNGTGYGNLVSFKTASTPSVNTVGVSKLGLTTATIGGNVTSEGSAAVEPRGVVYGTDSTKLDIACSHVTVSGTTGAFNADITGLSKNSVYYTRTFATNKYGVSYGAIVKIWTYDVADYDGNLYHTVKIGTQTWMVENLKVTHYRNGDPIPSPTANSRWANLTTGAYCNYNNSDSIAQKFGRLYTWYAATDSRNIAPAGWHVPTGPETTTLYNYVGQLYNHGAAGYLSGIHMMAITDWTNPVNFYGKADNETGFSALPSGNFSPDETGHWDFYYFGEAFGAWINDSWGLQASVLSVTQPNCWISNCGLCRKCDGIGIRLIKDN